MTFYVISYPRTDNIVTDLVNFFTEAIKYENSGFYSILAGPDVKKSEIVDVITEWTPVLPNNCKYICFKDLQNQPPI